jgi:ribose 5-phosphate isomerase B
MKLFLASDHAGFELKETIMEYIRQNRIDGTDLGTHSSESVNWVEYGALGARKVSEDPAANRAILICGTGIGMSIVANKFKNVRAARCQTPHDAEMSRKHNNSNILTLGARILTPKVALKIVQIWLDTPFEGGRHQTRLDTLHNLIEKQNFK